MNILLLSEDFYPKTSGGAFEDWNFAKGAVKCGHQVKVYTSRIKDSKESEIEEGVEINRPYEASFSWKHPNSSLNQFKRMIFMVALLIYMYKNTNKIEFDIICSTNHLMHPIAKILGSIYDIPVVNTVAYSPSQRDKKTKLDPKFIFEQINFRLFMGDLSLCRTEKIRQVIESKSNTETKIIHGVVEEDLIRQVVKNPTKKYDFLNDKYEKNIVIVGRLEGLKNIDKAIDIIVSLSERYGLTIVGDGEDRENIESYIEKKKVENRVEILGKRSHYETLEIIGKADTLILTSEVEAYPTVVFEALSLQTPVVAAPVGILPKINHNNLWVCSTEEMKRNIENRDKKTSNLNIDKKTLQKYSIGRFTATLLDEMESITKSEN